jgi:hypothetical protein
MPGTTISAAVAELPETVFRYIEKQNEVPDKYASKLGGDIHTANFFMAQGSCRLSNKSIYEHDGLSGKA